MFGFSSCFLNDSIKPAQRESGSLPPCWVRSFTHRGVLIGAKNVRQRLRFSRALLESINQPTPNGPYTLLKIYSYKLHCQSGLGLWAQRDRREGWPLSCSLGSHFCTQTQHYPGAKAAGSKGLEGPASWVGRGQGAQRGPAPPGPAGTHGRRWIRCLHLSIYRYLQKKVMSNRPQSCRRNDPQLARTGASQGFPRAAAPVGVFSRGTTRISGSLTCGAREVRSPCAWRGGARPGSRVTGGD